MYSYSEWDAIRDFYVSSPLLACSDLLFKPENSLRTFLLSPLDKPYVLDLEKLIGPVLFQRVTFAFFQEYPEFVYGSESYL